MLRTYCKLGLVACLLFVGCHFAAQTARAQDPAIWTQSVNFSTFHTFGPSNKSRAPYNLNEELADDFDLTGSITQVFAYGYWSGHCSSPPPDFLGVYVRFYAYDVTGRPGALQTEYFIAAGDTKLRLIGSDFRITISPAFQATGRHFLTVQPYFDPRTTCSNQHDYRWYFKSANDGAPRGTPFFYRDNTNASGCPVGIWGQCDFNVGNSDLGFILYGTRSLPPPVVNAVAPTAARQAGRITITGQGFGETQGAGLVKINGATAPVSRWSDTSITAYVPDAAPVGADTLQVVTTGGVSNAVPLNVAARPPQQGRVRWRLQIDSPIAWSRPNTAADGTIYLVDQDGQLYAVTPQGGVKWIFRSGGINSQQPPSIGTDGTIYIASGNHVWAVNPDGTQKWRFDDPSFSYVVNGPTFGPDGKIYGITADCDQAGGLGAFVLSAAGQLLANRPGFCTRGGYANIEIAFSAGQWFGTVNASGAVTPAGGLSAFPLGSAVRNWIQLGIGKINVSPVDGSLTVGDGNTVHPGIFTYNPNGTVKWARFRETQEERAIDQTTVDVGPDGGVYAPLRHNMICALTPAGADRWCRTYLSSMSNPLVSPQNTLFIGEWHNNPDVIPHDAVQAISTTDGTPLWNVQLPMENGWQIEPFNLARFNASGDTAYFGTTGPNGTGGYSYLYAIDAATAASANNAPTVRITSPADGTIYEPLTQINVRAEASDTDGQIVKVEFYLDDDLADTDTEAPYTYTWALSTPGTHTFKAVTFDNGSLSATSNVVTITVNPYGHDLRCFIRDDHDNALEGVTVTLSGSESGATTTDNTGQCYFRWLPPGGTYTLTPSRPGYIFLPPTRVFANMNEDGYAPFTAIDTQPGRVLISAFRFRGPAGPNDEFIELYNNSDAPVTVGNADGSGGWTLATVDFYGTTGAPVTTIPAGTVIPARGHYLLVNNTPAAGYTLNTLATPNATYAFDIADNSGLALFDEPPPGYSLAHRLDAVGFAGMTGASSGLYYEGTGLAPIGTQLGEYSFVRLAAAGVSQDTNNNVTDFVLVSTNGNHFGGAGPSILGAPAPANTNSPVQSNATIKTALIDPQQPSTAAPNRVRDLAPVTNGTQGTLTIRRKFTNKTGAPVTALRFRVIDITTMNTPNPGGAQADLRVLNASDVTITTTTGGNVLVRGVTVEQSPAQPQGGGLNSLLNVALPGGALAPNASINVQFVLGVEAGGRFRFIVNVEAGTNGPATTQKTLSAPKEQRTAAAPVQLK